MSKNYTLQNQYLNTNIEKFLTGLDKIFEDYILSINSEFQENIYTLDNARDQALDLWGSLLNIPRYIPNKEISISDDRNGWSLDNSNFYRLQFDELTKLTYIILTDLTFRMLIKLKIILMTTDATIPSISKICDELFQPLGGRAIILDQQNMTLQYVFEFELPLWFKYILDNYSILPKPMGVNTSYIENIYYSLGFRGQDPEKKLIVTNFFKSIFHKQNLEELRNKINNYNFKHTNPVVTRNKVDDRARVLGRIKKRTMNTTLQGVLDSLVPPINRSIYYYDERFMNKKEDEEKGVKNEH